jgi:hypothetical protein
VKLAPTSNGIVSGGLLRFRRSGEFAALRARLIAEARRRRGAELTGASFWRRAWLGLAAEREVRAELGRIHPPGALYFAGSAR